MRYPGALSIAAALLLLGSVQNGSTTEMNKVSTLPPIDSLWDYWDPAATRAKFEEIRPAAGKSSDRSYYLQLLTQIARTFGLESAFDRAHAVLDTVQQALPDAPQIVRVRYLLERGRAFRSSGSPEKAQPLFEEAYKISGDIGADFYTIDAAHMASLAVSEWKDKLKWNLIGVEIAEKTTDERARGWLSSLYNNIGWDYHDQKEYEQALEMFDKALAFRIEQGKPKEIGIAKWSVARALRSLERYDEALNIQLALKAENDSTGQQDGFVHEELGELYLVLGKPELSRQSFAAAYTELVKDEWFVKNESARLERIKTLSKAKE